jgi:hypothetical protein
MVIQTMMKIPPEAGKSMKRRISLLRAQWKPEYQQWGEGFLPTSGTPPPLNPPYRPPLSPPPARFTLGSLFRTSEQGLASTPQLSLPFICNSSGIASQIPSPQPLIMKICDPLLLSWSLQVPVPELCRVKELI